MVLAHDNNRRTKDVQISEDITFTTMLLSSKTEQGLTHAGFYKPSPIQLNGIPLGKCGFDLLLEAKSGTGKTAVFTVIALEKLDLKKGLQVIILAPTREIAAQICDVIKQIGSHYEGLRVEVVMGGLPVDDDIAKFKKKVHIVVGSPGRLRHLIQDDHIDTSAVRLLVLDEADKLMEKSFQADINYIFSYLPGQKQVIMSSATYPDSTKSFINQYVKNAQHVCPDTTNILIGIEQKVTHVMSNSNIVRQTKLRYEELIKILSSKQFKQCLIFCNYQARVAELHKLLTKDKWPSEQLYGKQEQTDRLDALKTLQEYKCRILVATDLVARGIDASNIDLVINFEPPYDWQTYLHRIGRAGRFGSYGIAITILSTGKEEINFKKSLKLMKHSLNIYDMWTNLKYNIEEFETESVELVSAQQNFPKSELSTGQDNDESNRPSCGDITANSINCVVNKLNFNPDDLLDNVWGEISTIADNDVQNFETGPSLDQCSNSHTFSDLLESYENEICNDNQDEVYSTLQCENVSAEECTIYLKSKINSHESTNKKSQDWIQHLKTEKSDPFLNQSTSQKCTLNNDNTSQPVEFNTISVNGSKNKKKDELPLVSKSKEENQNTNIILLKKHTLNNNNTSQPDEFNTISELPMVTKNKEENQNSNMTVLNKHELNGLSYSFDQSSADSQEMALMGLPTAFHSLRDIKNRNKNQKESISMHKEQKNYNEVFLKECLLTNENYSAEKIRDHQTNNIYKQWNTNKLTEKHKKSQVRKIPNHSVDTELDGMYNHSNTRHKSTFQTKSSYSNYINWYIQLKLRTKQIEMVLYVEELSKM